MEKYGSSSLCKQIWQKLDEKNNKHRNNPKDALIAETAIVRKFFLVTNEMALINVVKEDFGSAAITLTDFLAKLVLLNEEEKIT